MRSDVSTVPLDTLGVLRARGPDALSFLQGQLSNDLTRLATDRSLLAGYHNPQGRVIALLRVLQLAPEDLLAVLPRELVPTVMARLTKFILRAKVKLVDESQSWRITGLVAHGAALPAALDAVADSAGTVVQVALQPARRLLLMPAASPPPDAGAAAPPEIWRGAAIAAGEPQVYAATSEKFVAQMLNLDVLGAIAFDKGCYTGQEVIARAHYRGRVKRRMQRFATNTAVELAPGTAGVLSDGRPFKVVQAVAAPGGRTEFLAVAPLPAADEPRHEAQKSPAPLAAQALPLPYVLPE